MEGRSIVDSIYLMENKKENRKKGAQSTGQLQSKEDEKDEGTVRTDVEDSPFKERDDESSINRTDRFGTPIQTEVGKFSLQPSGNKSKVGDEQRDSVKSKTSNISGGTGEPASAVSKKTRHKISFLDEVTNDKSKLTDIHLIESYKKYN